MRRRGLGLSLGLLASIGIVGSPGRAQQTLTYSYDAQGRLTGVTATGQTSTATTGYSYDAASNLYAASVSGGSGQAHGGGPAPPGAGASAAPAAVPEAAAAPVTPGPLAIDSGASVTLDAKALGAPGGMIALFDIPSGDGSAVIAAGGRSVTYTAPGLAPSPACVPPLTASFSVPYRVADPKSGATLAAGTVSVTVKGTAAAPPLGFNCNPGG